MTAGEVSVPGAGQAHVLPADLLTELLQGIASPAALQLLSRWQRLLLWFTGLLGINRDPERRHRYAHWWLPLGRQVSVVGATPAGMQLALRLAQCGYRVSVIEAGADFVAPDADGQERDLLDQLRQASVVLINHSRVQRIDRATLLLDCAGSEIDIPADSVVLSGEGVS